ncbi:unnamed protein product [Larinioides sclopetarius]|uniref:Uncharacterized protein n=1 Tax=Larinioides sclopetarius TaxID=280406 RepID=A0AAV2ADQ8_9ARAC
MILFNFNQAPNVTLSAEGYKKTILLNDIEINLELWDTAGLERYRTIIKQYFRSADGVLLVYDKRDQQHS